MLDTSPINGFIYIGVLTKTNCLPKGNFVVSMQF